MRGRNTGTKEPASPKAARMACHKAGTHKRRMTLVRLCLTFTRVATPNPGIDRGKGKIPPRREGVKVQGNRMMISQIGNNIKTY
ncbi:MAG: hypothetical protein BECKG1743F_GA0114225_104293 [Candidatus Kentron sp. G]|nr:MAG: hypothetical protein BECKG1743F_GA0114225_104293 [Candidatus Kentron sp. G]VFN02845.1 MAG: hypothetical protein BECKG1743E_GA0114224_105503 [Candidatus Kentron sp. G]